MNLKKIQQHISLLYKVLFYEIVVKNSIIKVKQGKSSGFQVTVADQRLNLDKKNRSTQKKSTEVSIDTRTERSELSEAKPGTWNFFGEAINV